MTDIALVSAEWKWETKKYNRKKPLNAITLVASQKILLHNRPGEFSCGFVWFQTPPLSGVQTPPKSNCIPVFGSLRQDIILHQSFEVGHCKANLRLMAPKNCVIWFWVKLKGRAWKPKLLKNAWPTPHVVAASFYLKNSQNALKVDGNLGLCMYVYEMSMDLLNFVSNIGRG